MTGEPMRVGPMPAEHESAVLAGAFAKRRGLASGSNPNAAEPLRGLWLQGWTRPGLFIGEPMTREAAADYAAQWGETTSEGGVAAYNLGSPGFTAWQVLRDYALGECSETARVGLCCGIEGECVADLAELRRLAAFCEESR